MENNNVTSSLINLIEVGSSFVSMGHFPTPCQNTESIVFSRLETKIQNYVFKYAKEHDLSFTIYTSLSIIIHLS